MFLNNKAFRNCKLISLSLFLGLGIIFPYTEDDPRSVSTATSDFIMYLDNEQIRKFGELYTPQILPDGYKIKNVEFITTEAEDKAEYYSIYSYYENDASEEIIFIQSKDILLRQEIIQKYIDINTEFKQRHFYYREDMSRPDDK